VSAGCSVGLAALDEAPGANEYAGCGLEESQAVVSAASEWLGKDFDVDGDTLEIDSVTSGTGGTAALNSDGDIVFTSDGTLGAVDFTYSVSDGTLSDTATVALTVTEAEPENPYEDYRQGTEGRDVLFGRFFQENQIFGAGGNDKLFGGFLADSLAGGDGNDWLKGGFGEDLLEGNDGDDRMYGGFGDDTILGGDGNDKMFGSFGDDVIGGGAGNDTAWGGHGSDTFVYNSGDDHFEVRDFDFGRSWWWFSRPGDKLDINVDGIDTFDDLMDTASQSGPNTVFDFGDGDVLTLRNTRLSHFDADDFLF